MPPLLSFKDQGHVPYKYLAVKYEFSRFTQVSLDDKTPGYGIFNF